MKKKYLSLLAIPLITLPISTAIVSCSSSDPKTNADREETKPIIETVEKIEYKDSKLDEKILNVYPIGDREQTDITFTTKENKEKIEQLIQNKKQTNSYEDIKKIWLSLQEIHNKENKKFINDLLSKEEYDIFEMKNIEYTEKENGFSLSFSMNFSLKEEELAKEYKFNYSNVNILEENSTISEEYVLSKLLSDVEIINYDNNDYLAFLANTKLNKSLTELKEEYKNEPRKLLELLSENLTYKNLGGLVKQYNDLTVNVDSVKISNWKIENNIVKDLDKNLENLLTNFEEQGQESSNKIILSLQLQLPLSQNTDTKTIAFAFDIKIDEETSKKEIDSIKESLIENSEKPVLTQDDLMNLNYKISIEEYDSTINIINNSSSKEILEELFKSKEVSSKYSLSHELYEVSEGQDKLIQALPLRIEEFNTNGYRIDFVLVQQGLKEKIISVNIDTENLNNEFSVEDNSKILFNRIDNLNKQLLGNDFEKLNSIKQEIEELNIRKENIKQNDELDYENNEEYKKVIKDLETKENEKKEILYKNRLLVSAQAVSTIQVNRLKKEKEEALLKYILSDTESQDVRDLVYSKKSEEYKEKYNAYKGLLNSDPSKNFDFKLVDTSYIEKIDSQSVIQDKIYYDIQYSNTNENTGSSIIDDTSTQSFYKKNMESTINITFSYGNESKEIEFAIINPSTDEDIHQGQYEILSDALRNTDKEKVSYDVNSNILTVKTSAEKFTKFIEASNKHLESTTNSENSRILVNALNDALGHKPTFDNSNGIKYMDKYWGNFELYGFYWNEPVKNKINDINNKMQEEGYKVEDYTYSTLFAGAQNGNIRFAFYIQWVIE